MKKLLSGIASLFFCGCVGMPDKVKPVRSFELDRYLGTWYEIARLDHSFERGLEQVTAEYSLRRDGGVRVVNRGFSVATASWKEAEGRAFFVGDPTEGYLKVSFFGPFYGSYVIFGLDDAAYQYAYVCGPKPTYLWLLARTPTVGEAVVSQFIETAKGLGFETAKLIFVNQKVPSPAHP